MSGTPGTVFEIKLVSLLTPRATQRVAGLLWQTQEGDGESEPDVWQGKGRSRLSCGRAPLEPRLWLHFRRSLGVRDVRKPSNTADGGVRRYTLAAFSRISLSCSSFLCFSIRSSCSKNLSCDRTSVDCSYHSSSWGGAQREGEEAEFLHKLTGTGTSGPLERRHLRVTLS